MIKDLSVRACTFSIIHYKREATRNVQDTEPGVATKGPAWKLLPARGATSNNLGIDMARDGGLFEVQYSNDVGYTVPDTQFEVVEVHEICKPTQSK